MDGRRRPGRLPSRGRGGTALAGAGLAAGCGRGGRPRRRPPWPSWRRPGERPRRGPWVGDLLQRRQRSARRGLGGARPAWRRPAWRPPARRPGRRPTGTGRRQLLLERHRPVAGAAGRGDGGCRSRDADLVSARGPAAASAAAGAGAAAPARGRRQLLLERQRPSQADGVGSHRRSNGGRDRRDSAASRPSADPTRRVCNGPVPFPRIVSRISLPLRRQPSVIAGQSPRSTTRPLLRGDPAKPGLSPEGSRKSNQPRASALGELRTASMILHDSFLGSPERRRSEGPHAGSGFRLDRPCGRSRRVGWTTHRSDPRADALG